AMVLGLLAARRTPEEILKAYPYLEPEDIDQSLTYAAWRVEEREIPLASLPDETALLSEAALAQDWNRPGEDAAWSYLQSDVAYKQMGQDEAREGEALEWAESTLGDVADETR